MKFCSSFPIRKIFSIEWKKEKLAISSGCEKVFDFQKLTRRAKKSNFVVELFSEWKVGIDLSSFFSRSSFRTVLSSDATKL